MSESVSCACMVEDRKIPAFVIDNILRRLFRPPGKLLKKYLSGGETAVDLGCGPGFYTLPMARLAGADGRIYAVDFDRRAVEHLEQRAAGLEGGLSIAAYTASASDIDFIPDHSIDFVLAEGLLCCMQDHEGVIRQMRRILKPSGRAHLSVIKFGKPGDPRNVSKEEWVSLLSGFHVVESGESLVSRWAHVTPASSSRVR